MHKHKKINLHKRNKYRNYYLIEIAIIIALFICKDMHSSIIVKGLPQEMWCDSPFSEY